MSLTEWLRARTDAELAELLRRRPDLALPAPPDLATLAGRLAVRTSVQRAVDGLDAFLLRILEALVLCGPETSLDELAGALHGTATLEQTEHAVADLTATGLIWGDAAALNVLPTVPDSLGRYPAGLGRPAAALVAHLPDTVLAPVLRNLGLPPASQPRAGRSVAEALGDPARVAALLDELEPAERDVLTRLAAGPPLGGLRSAAAGETPAHRLVTRGLLVPIDAQSVELPREIGLALREHPMGEVGPEPPNVELTVREPAELDRAGTTAVLETIRLVDALALAWTVQPPAQLRSGGVGVRDLRRTARELGVDEPTAALIAEVAAAAGLVNATHGVEPVYLPTPDYDVWLRRDTATRWSDIALAWLGMTRQPSLVSQRGDRDRLITVLGPDAERGTIPALRQQVFEALAQLPPGSAPRQRDGLLSRLSWQAPRRASGQRPLAEAVLAEADLLGFTAAGGLTGYSRTLLAGSRAVAEQVLTSALPEPVDYFLVQPDLTVVVPGPPTPELARDLAVAADLESTGGASVYRVTEASLRRALDSGRSASELAAFLSERSRTPIPQSMQYLIDDLSRRHGALRSGAASAYLRCDDESLLTRVVTDRNVAVLQLRRLAPTVVVTTAPVARVLDVLRQAGYAPAAEAADGEVVSLSGDAPRAPSRQPVRTVRSRTTNNSSQLGEIVTRIRSGDALTELSRTVPTIAQQIPGVTSAATMGVLRDAIRDARRIMLGVAEPDGTTTRHTMLPISMGGGFVRGQETGATGLRSFPLHRITAVHVMAQADDQGDEEDE
ncbi:MAG: hypothetical protein JWQ77_1848 [Jatrophihabitans sp.]|nr:hypothetical protein [Jatrophihabitans sp.]